MTVEGARSIPSRFAPVLEALELDQPRVVTIADLDGLATEHGIDLDGTGLAYELRRLGWLLPLRTRGAWEFVPGSRAGRHGAGDRHIELRAALAVDPDFPGALAMESAAVALGLAGRVPEQEVLSLPPGKRLPKALDDWRVVRVAVGPNDVTRIDGLPVWRVETFLVAMATRPDGFQDWPEVTEWLGEAVGRADVAVIRRALVGAPRSVWRRTGGSTSSTPSSRGAKAESSGEADRRTPGSPLPGQAGRAGTCVARHRAGPRPGPPLSRASASSDARARSWWV